MYTEPTQSLKQMCYFASKRISLVNEGQNMLYKLNLDANSMPISSIGIDVCQACGILHCNVDYYYHYYYLVSFLLLLHAEGNVIILLLHFKLLLLHIPFEYHKGGILAIFTHQMKINLYNVSVYKYIFIWRVNIPHS